MEEKKILSVQPSKLIGQKLTRQTSQTDRHTHTRICKHSQTGRCVQEEISNINLVFTVVRYHLTILYIENILNFFVERLRAYFSFFTF